MLDKDNRALLRKKIFNHSPEKLYEYEKIKLMLTFSLPRKYVKPLTKELIDKLKLVKVILVALPEKLKKIKYVKYKIIELIRFIKELSFYQKQKAQEVSISKIYDV